MFKGHHNPPQHHYHEGRVAIKAFRGESKPFGKGWFAPFGYWVRQPSDFAPHKIGAEYRDVGWW